MSSVIFIGKPKSSLLANGNSLALLSQFLCFHSFPILFHIIIMETENIRMFSEGSRKLNREPRSENWDLELESSPNCKTKSERVVTTVPLIQG